MPGSTTWVVNSAVSSAQNRRLDDLGGGRGARVLVEDVPLGRAIPEVLGVEHPVLGLAQVGEGHVTRHLGRGAVPSKRGGNGQRCYGEHRQGEQQRSSS